MSRAAMKELSEKREIYTSTNETSSIQTFYGVLNVPNWPYPQIIISLMVVSAALKPPATTFII